MMFEMTNQIRVADQKEGQKWYRVLFNREADFIPHEGFAEWEILPGCWVQVAEGIPPFGSGSVRFGEIVNRKEHGLSGSCRLRNSKSMNGMKCL